MTIETIANEVRRHLGSFSPRWAVVAGSGVGSGLLDPKAGLGLDEVGRIELTQLGMPHPTVTGHGQALVWGTLTGSGIPVCVQTGRVHPYEGHPADLCTAVLRGLFEVGADRLALTCAVGSLRTDLTPGTLVSLGDQINLFGPTPLEGPRFIDCSGLYAPELRESLQTIARGRNETLPEAVYAHARGPQYETPAEVAALRSLGGDVVGMSTTYEAILAAAHGVRTCGLGIVTNTAGIEGLDHAEVGARSQAAVGRLSAILRGLMVDGA